MSTADVKLNQGAFPSFANWGIFVCVCDNKSGEAFVEELNVPGVLLRTDSAARPAAAAAASHHNTSRSRAPSVIFCDVTDVASRPPHASSSPITLHHFKPPAACRCALAEGAADAERAPRQFYFSLFFPRRRWQSVPVPNPSPSPAPAPFLRSP